MQPLASFDRGVADSRDVLRLQLPFNYFSIDARPRARDAHPEMGHIDITKKGAPPIRDLQIVLTFCPMHNLLCSSLAACNA